MTLLLDNNGGDDELTSIQGIKKGFKNSTWTPRSKTQNKKD